MSNTRKLRKPYRRTRGVNPIQAYGALREALLKAKLDLEREFLEQNTHIAKPLDKLLRGKPPTKVVRPGHIHIKS